MKTTISSLLGLALLAAAPLSAQAPDVSATLEDGPSFGGVTTSLEEQLQDSIQELARLREQRAAEQVPLNRSLRELRSELLGVRDEYKRTKRLLDSRNLDVSTLTAQVKAAEADAAYLSGLLGDYALKVEAGLHITELQRYADELQKVKLAVENTRLTEGEVVEAQLELLGVSLDRLHDSLGGTRFAGTAVAADGQVKEGTFVLVGPSALFRSTDGTVVGTAEQRLGSLEPTVFEFSNPEDTAAAAELVSAGWGRFPFDPTLGNAHQVEASELTLLDEIKKGGPVMIPIGIMAGLALLVAIFKWISLTLLRKPSKAQVDGLLDAMAKHDDAGMREAADGMKGPLGEMLRDGVDHIREPRSLVEEVMYETSLKTKLNLQKALPFIAICAASAPLLGLLGTVQGIINTFKLITIFGSGDVKTLSSGISEALITTKFGLIVAIPSLLLHAFLARKAKGIAGQMEATAVSFLNQASRSHYDESGTPQSQVLTPAPDPDLVRSHVKTVLGDLLGPMVKERLAEELRSSPPAAKPANGTRVPT